MFEWLPSDVPPDNNEYFGHTGTWVDSEQDDNEFPSLLQVRFVQVSRAA